MDEWSKEEKLDLSSGTIQKFAKNAAQDLILPEDTNNWVAALKTKDISKVKKFLKSERKTLPTQYKRLYRESDDKILTLIHYMRTKYPFFTPQEKRESELFLQFKDYDSKGVSHPILNTKIF